MAPCLFCKIRDGEVPARLVHEDDRCLAFEDLHPQAPMHLLVIPRVHVESLNELQVADEALAGHLLTVGAALAKERGHAGEGWRAVFNTNRAAGQTVFHLHLHVLGGRALGWPPG